MTRGRKAWALPAPSVVADDLVACGFPAAAGNEIDRSVLAFLDGHGKEGPISQIRSEQHSDLVRVFDRLFLAGQDGGSSKGNADGPAR